MFLVPEMCKKVSEKPKRLKKQNECRRLNNTCYDSKLQVEDETKETLEKALGKFVENVLLWTFQLKWFIQHLLI